MNWIKVEKELPKSPEYDWVLVIAKMIPEGYYGVPAVAELRRGIWYFRDEEKPAEETLGIKVTHWMPLPPNP
jgi:hypothetical protein